MNAHGTSSDPPAVDFIEGGSGPLVVLVHSSVAGARQWRKLIDVLAPGFHVRAVNLHGYGRTPAWRVDRVQSLEDQAGLVEAAVPAGVDRIRLVGHSFGGSVAMKAALRLGARVEKLVLFEPNPFSLLRDNACDAAFAEICALRDIIKEWGGRGEWEVPAERFADYWGGPGTWAATSAERRVTFMDALRPVVHEWDAVMGETTRLADWVDGLPGRTTVIHDPATVRPIREIVGLLKDAAPHWLFETIPEGGHMAPLTRPDVVNPVIAKALRGEGALASRC